MLNVALILNPSCGSKITLTIVPFLYFIAFITFLGGIVYFAVVNMTINELENRRKMASGELYHAFTPELIEQRARCKHACTRYNNAGDVPRRKLTELFKE